MFYLGQNASLSIKMPCDMHFGIKDIIGCFYDELLSNFIFLVCVGG
jgi:hypothetical protein